MLTFILNDSSVQVVQITKYMLSIPARKYLETHNMIASIQILKKLFDIIECNALGKKERNYTENCF